MPQAPRSSGQLPPQAEAMNAQINTFRQENGITVTDPTATANIKSITYNRISGLQKGEEIYQLHPELQLP